MSGNPPTHNTDELFSWQTKIPSLFYNPPLFKNLFLATALPGPIIMFIIGLFAAGWAGGLRFALMGLVIGGAFFVLSLIVSFIVTTGDVGYSITKKGVRFIAGKFIRQLNRMVVVGGGAGGSLSAAGSGLLAASREDETFTWDQAHIIRIYRKHGIIIMRRRSRFTPMAIYATKENFAQVRQVILENCPNARVKET